MESDLRTLSGPIKLDNSIQVNKWIRVALAVLIALLGAFISWGAGYDWTQIMTKETAGKLVFVFGLLKTAYSALAPSAGKGTVPTDGYVITQRGITKV